MQIKKNHAKGVKPALVTGNKIEITEFSKLSHAAEMLFCSIGAGEAMPI
jgi:hypothetical protein